MIYYKDFKWQQPKIITDGLPEPRPCPHCGGSALVSDGSVECGKNWFERSEACGFNHYEVSSTIRAIELWNKYDNYSQVKFEERSDAHYELVHGSFEE